MEAAGATADVQPETIAPIAPSCLEGALRAFEGAREDGEVAELIANADRELACLSPALRVPFVRFHERVTAAGGGIVALSVGFYHRLSKCG